MYIKRLAVWFRVWFKCSRVQVKSDIEEIGDLEIRFDCDSEIEFLLEQFDD